MSRAKIDAQGRLDHGPPLAVIDIGSNSVRLVVYEGLTRSPTPLFNEKALCGLGREVQSTGLLAADAVEQALGGAQALPRAVHDHGREESFGHRHRRLPRRQERPRLHQARRANHRDRDRRAVRRPRGAS